MSVNSIPDPSHELPACADCQAHGIRPRVLNTHRGGCVLGELREVRLGRGVRVEAASPMLISAEAR